MSESSASRREFMVRTGVVCGALIPAVAGVPSFSQEKKQEKTDEEISRAEGFFKVVGQVSEVEKKLGIYELAQFTPKV